MSTTTIAVGTESTQKIGYLEEVLTELGIVAEIIPVKAPSGVSEQPFSSEETLRGATNRAQAALEAVSQAEYSLGIEVGYDRVSDNRYKIFCWAVVIDRKENIAKAKSHSFLLPNFYQDVLKDGQYLGDHVREYFDVAADPITQYVAEAVRGRKLFISESLRYALIYAFHSEFYSSSKE